MVTSLYSMSLLAEFLQIGQICSFFETTIIIVLSIMKTYLQQFNDIPRSNISLYDLLTNTVEPPRKGYFGELSFVLFSEVVLISETS